MDPKLWEEIRANTEIAVHASGERGVRLNGGPMDGWLVLPSADALQPDWYKTWPPSIRDEHLPGRYELAAPGSHAQWIELEQ